MRIFPAVQNRSAMIPSSAVAITKEDIPSLRFPSEAVHLSVDHRDRLRRKLDQAMRLGNNEQVKCRILFRDDQGIKYVETTVWTFDRDRIVLKYGTTIPIQRVIDIQFP